MIDIEFRNGWEIEIEHRDEYKLFEKEFRNDLTLYGADIRWPIGDRWRFSYELTRLELTPDPDNDSTTIHVFDALYAFHANLYVKAFIQTNSSIEKENIQLLGVWCFQPPFGALQLAYQRGTSEQGEESEQGDTFFTKFSWVF